MPEKLLLATNNRGKVREYRSLLDGFSGVLVTPADAGVIAQVEETGETYADNARLKAVTLAQASGMVTLADDSGLEVAALGGEPGVRSARYAGENASDRERLDYLLRRLEGVPVDKRAARFCCVIAVAAPDGRVGYCSGECSGVITTAIKGEGGFGYDPVFYLPELDRTMAELSFEEKNRVSHRGQAARKVPALLVEMGL